MAKKNPAQPVTLQPDLRKKNRSQMSLAMRRLMKNKTAILGLIIIISLILLALFADVLFDYDEVVIKQNIAEMRQPPSLARMSWDEIFWPASCMAPESRSPLALPPHCWRR